MIEPIEDCQEGFALNRDRCYDIDECENLNKSCTGNATCHNNVGSFICSCERGYTLVNESCIDHDECLSKSACPENSLCMNIKGGYSCDCETGFEGFSCDDVDECLNQTELCNSTSKCINSEGSYFCQSKLIQETVVNYCEQNACDKNAFCVNLEKNYMCFCQEGYFGNGYKCFKGNCFDNYRCPKNEVCRNSTSLRIWFKIKPFVRENAF